MLRSVVFQSKSEASWFARRRGELRGFAAKLALRKKSDRGNNKVRQTVVDHLEGSSITSSDSFTVKPRARGLNATIKPVAAGGKDLVIAGPVSARSLSPADAPFTFSNTGSLHTPRGLHTTTLLSNGKVLVAGGENGGALSSAE